MKILDLTLQAFGPFLKKQHIPFNELNDKGMFLINGPTGTGKTTIFDAIVYALYGQASGEDRNDASMMRSDFASENDITEVYLKFEANGKIYQITRRAPYVRKALRGGGFTKVEGSCELILPDGEVISKTSEVNNKIKDDILFLNIDQFKNVALLAQGEFTKLITASSKEREPILEHIFQKEIYAKMQDKINKRFADVLKERDNTISGLKTLIENIENGEDITGYHEALLDASNVQVLLNSLKEIITSKSEEIKANDKLLEEKKKEYEDASQSLRDLRNNNEIIQKYLDALIKEEALRKNQENINHLEMELEKDHEASLIAPLVKDIEKSRRVISLNEETIKRNNEVLNNLKEDIKYLEDNKERYQTTKEDLPNLKSSLNILKTINEERNSLIRLKGEVDKKDKEFNERYQDYLKKEEEFIAIRTHFYASSSYNLAKELKEGEPCPVCGSVHHPSLATYSDPVSEATFNQAEKEFKKLTDNINKEREELNKAKVALESKEENVVTLLKKNGFEDASLDFIYSSKINNLIKEKEEEISELESFIKNYEKKQKDVSDISLRCSTQNKEAENTIKTSEEDIENTSKELTKLLESNKHLKSVYFYNEYKKKPVSNPKQVKEDIETHKAELIKVKSIIENTPKQLVEAGKVDESNLVTEVSEKKQAYQDFDKLCNDTKNHVSNIQKSLTAIEKKYHECEGIIKRYQSIAELNNTASGRGSKKLSFKMYILADYFDKIIHQANLRLSRMSGGRYRLIRSEKLTGKGMQGLDLEVFDMETGKNRAAPSLSGGEKFVSALSMALGLSDIIESNHALVQVESIFIDEGFGTLDNEYIDMAMKTLEKLKDGEKVIAIISHVERLKEYIPDGLEVVKDDIGSKIIMKNNI